MEAQLIRNQDSDQKACRDVYQLITSPIDRKVLFKKKKRKKKKKTQKLSLGLCLLPGVAAAAAALPLLEALRCVCGVRSDRWQLQAGLLHHSMYFIIALKALVSLITAENNSVSFHWSSGEAPPPKSC